MAKRLLDCFASDIAKFTKADLLSSIAKSEGRVLAAETIGTVMPMLADVTNAEFAAAMGADILLLNMFDVNKPIINGLKCDNSADTVRELKRLTGRVIGINLEPVPENAATETAPMWAITDGRRATAENAIKAADMGVNMILLTGNPGMGVTNEAILSALRNLHEAVGERVVLAAGKMHASGALRGAKPILTADEVKQFVAAGADILLVPAPGTVPGMTQEAAKQLADAAHENGALAMTTIGTSQEGADTQTIRSIALMCKMAGADIHHIGDTGYGGVALPENITAYSVAIRGIRHTYHRMAASVNR
ncbi:MAG: haloacid dehalogenase-like hydrolase [Clostridia bacterium]|nr:haloacid dehalogenase-like hydrolase [Clostridia bacterium]NLS84628.1 haloacid dehalogenase-like hydrolase [Oscillospiraceae bacterium]